jgi:riboflavin synthase
MFTGIIEDQGVVTSFIPSSHNAKLVVACGTKINDLKAGDSMCVNGVCLTVSKIRRNFAEFDLSPETIKRTNFIDLKIGSKVNLERALTPSTRMGGHIVSGHIDGLAEVREKIQQNKGFELSLSLPSNLLRYLVPKGSIAVEGVSLTIADIRDDLVVIAVIPVTAAETVLGNLRIGDRVNVEVDMLSKYVERHLQAVQEPLPSDVVTRVGFMPMGWIEN